MTTRRLASRAGSRGPGAWWGCGRDAGQEQRYVWYVFVGVWLRWGGRGGPKTARQRAQAAGRGQAEAGPVALAFQPRTGGGSFLVGPPPSSIAVSLDGPGRVWRIQLVSAGGPVFSWRAQRSRAIETHVGPFCVFWAERGKRAGEIMMGGAPWPAGGRLRFFMTRSYQLGIRAILRASGHRGSPGKGHIFPRVASSPSSHLPFFPLAGQRLPAAATPPPRGCSRLLPSWHAPPHCHAPARHLACGPLRLSRPSVPGRARTPPPSPPPAPFPPTCAALVAPPVHLGEHPF
jgi:hypothetical protein